MRPLKDRFKAIVHKDKGRKAKEEKKDKKGSSILKGIGGGLGALKDKASDVGTKLAGVDVLKEKFETARAWPTSVLRPNKSFKTYKYSIEGKPVTVTGKDGKTEKVKQVIYSWVEANINGDGEYTLQQVDETRAGDSVMAGEWDHTETPLTVNGRTTFSKDELYDVLSGLEKELKDKGYAKEDVQPFKSQHYSWIQEPPEKKSKPEPRNGPA